MMVLPEEEMDFCVNECDRPEIDYLMSTRTCVLLFYQYAHTPSQLLSQPPCYSSQLSHSENVFSENA